MTTERLFVGISLDVEVRHGLAAHLDADLAGSDLPGRPVRPVNWHLTLRFLGDTDEVTRDRFLGALEETLPGPPFTMGFGALGAFPRASRATVLWLALDRGADRLASWALACETAARRAGLEAEDRPFRPHVTLSRIRPPADVRSILDETNRFPLAQVVDAATLFRSTLGPTGTTYDEITRIPAQPMVGP